MRKHILVSTVVLSLVAGISVAAFAKSGMLDAFNGQYGTAGTALDSCWLCHPGGVKSQLNGYGQDYLDTGQNFGSIEGNDSDGDDYLNIEEITAGTFPGDKNSFPDASIPDSPPVADAGPDQTVDGGVLVTLDASNSTDPDQDITDYQWTQTEGDLVTLSYVSATARTFIAPVIFGANQSLRFELTVTDSSNLTDTDYCIINVTYQNRSPVADAGPDQTVDGGTEVTLLGRNSSDPDNTPITYTWSQTSGTPVSLYSEQAPTTGFIAPEPTSEVQVLEFTLVVEDSGGLKDSDTCTININRLYEPIPNIAPVADAGADQTVSSGSFVTLDGSQSYDTDGNTLSYLWTQTNGDPVTLSDPTAASPEFTAPSKDQPVQLGFTLTVGDEGGLEATDACLVNVEAVDPGPVNAPPVADAGSDQVAAPGDSVMLDGTASYDPDDDYLTYHWTQDGGAPVLLTNSDQPLLEFQVPAGMDVSSNMVFSLTITDPLGLSDSQTVTVTISVPLSEGSLENLVVFLEGIIADPTIEGGMFRDLKKSRRCLVRAMEQFSRGRMDSGNLYLLQSAQTIGQVLAELPSDGSTALSLNSLLAEIESRVDPGGTTGGNGGGSPGKGNGKNKKA